jgi:hypothetical protein
VGAATLPLESGKYRLVSVDEIDRHIETVDPVEIMIPASGVERNLRMVVLEGYQA